MVEYKCDRCKKNFRQKIDYERHKGRKRPCQEVLASELAFVSIEKVKQEINSENKLALVLADDKKEYKCKNCESKFRHKSSLSRHKSRCNKNEISIIHKRLDELREEIKDRRIKKINSHNNNVNSNNVINNITNNTIIKLVEYGEEDHDDITREEWIRLIKRPEECVNKFTKFLHFNKEYPQYQNINVSNLHGKFLKYYDGERWQTTPKKEFVTELIEYKIMRLLIYLERLDEKKKLPSDVKVNLKMVQDWYEKNDYINKFKDKVISEMYSSQKELDEKEENDSITE